MTFTQFYGGDSLPNQWMPHLQSLVGKPNLSAVEIGSLEGMSALFVLTHILTHPTARLVCIDPFVTNQTFLNGHDIGDYYARFRENLRPFRDQVRVVKRFSQDAYPELLFYCDPLSVDFTYIDGSHEYQDTLADAEMMHGFLKPGGVMVFDDTAWADPQRAVSDFIAKRPVYETVQVWPTQTMIRKK